MSTKQIDGLIENGNKDKAWAYIQAFGEWSQNNVNSLVSLQKDYEKEHGKISKEEFRTYLFNETKAGRIAAEILVAQ